MTQQVNLYQPILRQQKRVFSSGNISLIVIGAIALMALLWSFNLWQLHDLELRLEEATQREATMATEVTRLTREMSNTQVSSKLKAEVEQLREEARVKEQLVNEVFSGDSADARLFGSGFVVALEALGRQRVDGLWMTRIEFRDAGGSVSFAGRTQHAEHVPALVRKLANEPALRQVSFRTVRVRRDEDAHLAFVLSTERPAAEEGNK